MLSDDVQKALDKYNQEKKAQYEPTCPRMAKVHEEDHDEADHPDNPEPDLSRRFIPHATLRHLRPTVNTWSSFSQNGIHISYLQAL